MMKSGHYDYLTGYKATTASMTCQGFQFQLGVWYSIPESTQLEPCRRGFHFCIHPSGPRYFYSKPTDRVFECEARDVLVEYTPGALLKCVARHIRLVSEIHPSGDQNTGDHNIGNRNAGDYNTGDYNTGDCNAGAYNTGHGNTGDQNAGDQNTGDYNTGHGSTGDQNTGDHNTGDQNTGHCNTGDRNTGNQNTGCHNTGHCNAGDHNTGHYNTGTYNTGNLNKGHYNTGNRNTGSYNTGWGNATDNCTGFFCSKEPEVLCFDTPTGLTRSEFLAKYGTLVSDLAQEIISPEKFDYTAYKDLPGWSLRGIEALHKAHLKGRQPLQLS